MSQMKNKLCDNIPHYKNKIWDNQVSQDLSRTRCTISRTLQISQKRTINDYLLSFKMAANSYHISLIVVLSSCVVHTLGFRVPQSSLPVVVNTWDFKPATDAGKKIDIFYF